MSLRCAAWSVPLQNGLCRLALPSLLPRLPGFPRLHALQLQHGRQPGSRPLRRVLMQGTAQPHSAHVRDPQTSLDRDLLCVPPRPTSWGRTATSAGRDFTTCKWPTGRAAQSASALGCPETARAAPGPGLRSADKNIDKCYQAILVIPNKNI